MHQGHYVLLQDRATSARISEIAMTYPTAFRGINRRYPWNALEPTEGAYDFSLIEQDLNLCAEFGMFLVPMIADNSFKADSHHVPEYLREYTTTRKGPAEGIVCARWHPVVTNRFRLMCLALTRACGNHLAFEALQLQETAAGMTAEDLKRFAYTPEAYASMYVTLINSVRAMFSDDYRPKKNVLWSANFFALDREGVEIQHVVDATKCGLGGPDCWITSVTLRERVYPIYSRNNDVTRFIGMSTPSYSQRKPDGTLIPLADSMNFAINDLGVDYIFWTDQQWPGEQKGYTIKDAFPLVMARPTF